MLIVVGVVVFGSMLIEARRSWRNELALLARGGIEPRDDVYHVMRIAYPAAFLAMIAESLVRGAPSPGVVMAGVALFGAAKALKYWAIATLGPFWSFRVIVVPGAALVAKGPYRYLRHPNYVGVIGELTAVALMTGARLIGPVVTMLFALILLRRITVEEQALAANGRSH